MISVARRERGERNGLPLFFATMRATAKAGMTTSKNKVRKMSGCMRNASMILPCNRSRMARVLPQPAQGIPNTDEIKHDVPNNSESMRRKSASATRGIHFSRFVFAFELFDLSSLWSMMSHILAFVSSPVRIVPSRYLPEREHVAFYELSRKACLCFNHVRKNAVFLK